MSPRLQELDLQRVGWLSRRQTAEMLGTNPTYLDRLVNEGRIVAYLIRGTSVRLFRRRDVQEYMDRNPLIGTRRSGAA